MRRWSRSSLRKPGRQLGEAAVRASDVDAISVHVADGTPLPRRRDLGDNDNSQWPIAERYGRIDTPALTITAWSTIDEVINGRAVAKQEEQIESAPKPASRSSKKDPSETAKEALAAAKAKAGKQDLRHGW